MKLLYICLASIVLLSGCGKSNERVVVKEKRLPLWYIQPPASNAGEIYGVGDGKDKQEALSNALASLLATLSVSISSKYSAKSVVHEGRANRHNATYVNETQSEVQKIRISNYEVLQSAKLGFKKYAVLIKVDRIKFFQTLQKEIDQEFALIASWEKNRADKNALEQLLFYKRALQNLSDLQNRLLVMSVLNERFQSQKYLQRYGKLQNKKDKLLQSITFWITSDYRPLSGVIEKGLSSKKLKIKNLHNAYHFTIYLKSNMQRAISYGFYIARSQINISVKDNSGNILATNVLNIAGQSSQSYTIAKQDVAKKLSRQIDKEGIAKILNLNI